MTAQAVFTQAAITFAAAMIAVFVSYYTWATRGANWKDPVGLTLVLGELLTLADISVAIVRWFVAPQTPLLLNAEIWAQAGIILLFGLVLAWRTAVFRRVHARRELAARHGKQQPGP